MGNIMSFITDYVGAELAISVLAGLAAMAMVFAVWSALVNRDPMGRRIEQLNSRRDALHEDMLATERNHIERVFTPMNFMQRVVQRMKLLKSGKAADIALVLSRAGYRSRDALVIYLFMKTVLPMAFSVAALMLMFASSLFAIPMAVKILISLVATGAGFYAPDIAIKNIAQKRSEAVEKGLPDALDLLVICTEAGLSLDASLNRVADEMGPASPELADEFGLTAIELGFLPKRRDALSNLTARCQLASIRGVVGTLMQTEKYGTPLAQSLRVLSTEFRSDRMMRAEEKAARLPATMTVPLVMFILPCLFVVLLGPAIISTIDGLGGL